VLQVELLDGPRPLGPHQCTHLSTARVHSWSSHDGVCIVCAAGPRAARQHDRPPPELRGHLALAASALGAPAVLVQRLARRRHARCRTAMATSSQQPRQCAAVGTLALVGVTRRGSGAGGDGVTSCGPFRSRATEQCGRICFLLSRLSLRPNTVFQSSNCHKRHARLPSLRIIYTALIIPEARRRQTAQWYDQRRIISHRSPFQGGAFGLRPKSLPPAESEAPQP
jgi:hypothetical protein